MIQVPDNVIAELIRHIPMVLELLPTRPPTKSLRVANAIRMTKINIDKLKKIDYEHRKRKHHNLKG